MAINIDLSETKNPGAAGEFQRVSPGACHLLVMEAKENGGNKGEHVIKFEVLNHVDQSQIGMTHTEYFSAEAKMAWKLLIFCYAVKIADRERMEAAKASGSNYAPIDLESSVGRQLFATVKASENNGKTYHNLDGLLAIDDPKADRHPRNVGMLAQAKGVAPASQTMPAPSTPSHSAQPSAAADPFAKLV
jgi:hypothetical protein